MAHSNSKAQIVHHVYHHDPTRIGKKAEDIFCYWTSKQGTYLTRHGAKLPARLPKPNKSNNAILPGVYEHFKGNFYYVVDCLELFGTGTFYVIYFSLKPGETVKWFYRPADEFSEFVKRDSRQAQRFRKI